MNSELDFDEWQNAIGKLIMSCSRVEYELNRFYKKRLPERSYFDDTYLKRFDKSIELSKKIFNPQNGIAEGLIEMRKVATYRHLIAHNPIHYSNETETWHIFDLKSNKTSVSLNELVLIAKEAELISIKVTSALRING